jgi:hypothetical protein
MSNSKAKTEENYYVQVSDFPIKAGQSFGSEEAM